jgi:hypothetical protein
LRKLTKNEYTDPAALLWTDTDQATLEDMKNTIISNPCLQRFDYQKLVLLCTDFSALGFGYMLLQPGNNDASIKASQEYREGKGVSFMTKDFPAVLHHVCLGLGNVAAIKFGYTLILILASVLQVTVVLIRTDITCLANALSGSQTVMLQSSFCSTRMATVPYFGCRCA